MPKRRTTAPLNTRIKYTGSLSQTIISNLKAWGVVKKKQRRAKGSYILARNLNYATGVFDCLEGLNWVIEDKLL